MRSDIGSKEIKVVVSKSKAQAKSPKKAKTKPSATDAIRARFISRSNAVLREFIDGDIAQFAREHVFRLLGFKFGPWDSMDVTQMDPVLGAHLGKLAEALRERIVAEVKQIEFTEKEIVGIRAAYEKLLKAKVMEQVEQEAEARAEVVAAELVDRAIVAAEGNEEERG